MSSSQRYPKDNDYDLPKAEDGTSSTSTPRSRSTSRYPIDLSRMASVGSNDPDIISHQPTAYTGHTNYPTTNTNNTSPNNNNNNNRDRDSTTSNSSIYGVNSTAPWTYVPSGSTPLQRQDFHSSMKSLNINGFSSPNSPAQPDHYNTSSTPFTYSNPDKTTTTTPTDVDEYNHRRVSSTMSQLSTTSIPTTPTPTPTTPAPGTSAFGSRDWSSDLFESFIECRKTRPVTSSLRKFFRDCLCVPCMMCDIAKSLGDKMCLPFIPGTGAAIRFKVRILGGIQGTIADDCLVTSCCCPCAVCQMYREIDDIGLATR